MESEPSTTWATCSGFYIRKESSLPIIEPNAPSVRRSSPARSRNARRTSAAPMPMQVRMRITIALLLSLISMQAQIPQPTDFDGWTNRGHVLLRAGQFQEAADAFERATNLKPNDAGARLYLGSAYMLMSFGAPSAENVAPASRARTGFKRVLALDPENTMAAAALAAMSYQEAERLKE